MQSDRHMIVPRVDLQVAERAQQVDAGTGERREGQDGQHGREVYPAYSGSLKAKMPLSGLRGLCPMESLNAFSSWWLKALNSRSVSLVPMPT